MRLGRRPHACTGRTVILLKRSAPPADTEASPSSPRSLRPRYNRRRMMFDSQALFARAADGMYVVDASLVIVDVNDAFATMMGTTRASMLGRQITGYVQREHLRLHPPQTEIVARDGSAIVMRLFQRADGTTMEGEVAATQLDDGGIFCVVRDVKRRAAVSALRD